jgi:ATP synthase protein I
MSNHPDDLWRTLGQAASLGTLLAACIFVGLGLGLWLDSVLKTKPWLTLVFLLLGIVAGFYNVIRVFTDINRPRAKP